MSDDLDPLAPQAAMDLYLDARKEELSKATLSTHTYRVQAFVDYLELQGIRNMNDVGGRDIHAYRVYRREEDDLKAVTLQGQLSTVKQFLRLCASVDAVPENLPEKVLLPNVGKAERSDDTKLGAARTEAILDYLSRYEYASRKHVILLLLWRTSMRRGGLRAIDVDDFDPEEPSLSLRHRPEEDTPLKNGLWGERDVSLHPYVGEVVADYIDGPRKDRPDQYGRDPLITTTQGRAALSTIQNIVYGMTRPCKLGEPCPHDRDPDECDAAQFNYSSSCPSSRSPHQVRTGSISAHLDAGTPKAVLSDRADASEQILDEHYDKATQREKMRRRRDYIAEDL